MKSSNIAAWLAIAALFVPLAAAHADFTCRAELSYHWLRNPPPKPSAVPGAPPPAPTVVPTPEAVQWGSFELVAKDEEAGKAALAKIGNQKKPEAFAACRKTHEDLSNCVTTKFATMSSTLQALGFSARRAVEEAITGDCSAQLGRCIESKMSDPQCIEIKSAVQETPVEEKKGKEKKK